MFHVERNNYWIGDLFGTPGLRGYFFGVFFVLLKIKIERSLSSIGNKNE